ncbi:H-NS histone family protein [Polaromonas naphthalenivorans]|uniref:Histone-like nucleoid-structuring protein H-NS n=1 Tax=Polaromonas naphthalenivorans (strain CJ2) TaxID=365044 RepID=A1VUA7_POLNA|nr:H-NS histone family protein [Polaromonas naphthalenivorans]ABM39235.1 histone-like nucleoid-structuring protein H-NS [Polaromonas naphthalenivorans CJ2]
MSNTLQELLAERDALDQRIKELQAEARLEAISNVLSLIDRHGLKENDLFSSGTSTKKNKYSATKVPAKYRDSETGSEWSGRGIPPVWLRGKDKKDYLIA